MKTLKQYIEEIDRRGFLKGLGAAAVAGAAGKSIAQSDDDLDKIRQDNLRRISAMAASTDPASQSAKKYSGPTVTYAQILRKAIKPNITFDPSGLEGNPVADVLIKTAPDGTILAIKLDRPSGNNDWDQAVLNAVQKTKFLPRDIDGRIPPVLVLSFRPL